MDLNHHLCRLRQRVVRLHQVRGRTYHPSRQNASHNFFRFTLRLRAGISSARKFSHIRISLILVCVPKNGRLENFQFGTKFLKLKFHAYGNKESTYRPKDGLIRAWPQQTPSPQLFRAQIPTGRAGRDVGSVARARL